MTQKGKKMSLKEIDAVLRSPEAFARYLAGLTPEQIAEYKEVFIKDKSMDENVRKTLLRLFDAVENEAKQNVALYEERVLPLANGIAVAQTLQEQIDALDRIARSL